MRMANEQTLGLLGATSLVGQCLLPLLTKNGYKVFAYSRHTGNPSNNEIEWQILSKADMAPPDDCSRQLPIANWICVAPLWVLPEYFERLKTAGARRIVALSSTSRFSKESSSDTEERKIAQRLTNSEICFQTWASDTEVEWVIIRPTLIYGCGRDKNISEIVRFIRRFGFFPLLGQATGLRQPIHAADVAGACLAALQTPNAANRAYNISGGETLTYRDMVSRVFSALGHPPRMLTVPHWVFCLAVTVIRSLPRYRQWSTAMAERMMCDLVFEHTQAAQDLEFKPRPFLLEAGDLHS